MGCFFHLRPDGLGNRLEQIMLLNLHQPDDGHVRLIWPSHSNGRGNSYAGHSQWLRVLPRPHSRVVIVEEQQQQESQATLPRCAILSKNEQNTTAWLQQLLDNAARIRPRRFRVTFPQQPEGDYSQHHGTYFHETAVPPVGVHIRKTDRLTQKIVRTPGVKEHSTSVQESANIVEAIFQNLANERPCSGVFVASDSPVDAQRFKQRLRDAGVRVVEPIVTLVDDEADDDNDATPRPPSTQNQPPAYMVDFFALAACREIYMGAVYSSFAVFAARVGDFVAPLHSFLHPEATALDRHYLPVVYPLSMSHKWQWQDTPYARETRLNCTPLVPYPSFPTTTSAKAESNSTTSTTNNNRPNKLSSTGEAVVLINSQYYALQALLGFLAVLALVVLRKYLPSRVNRCRNNAAF